MSKKRGICVRQGGDRWSAVEIAPDGKRGWSIGQLSRGVSPQPLPAALLRKAKRGGGTLIWLMPDDEARSSLLTTPHLKGKALERALMGMLAREEGGQPTDWAVSWQTLPAPKRDKKVGQTVYVVHARQEEVQKHLGVAAVAGSRPTTMLPGHLALDLFYRRHGPEKDAHPAWNLVFVGRQEQFLCVSTRDSLLMTRNLPPDLSAGQDTDEYLGRLATEVERSIFFAKQTEFSPQVERIFVCGDAELAAGLVSRLQDQELVPAIHWDFERSFSSGGEAIEPDDLIALAGAVVGLEGSPFSLLPRVSRFSLTPQLRRRGLVAGATCAATVVPVLLVGGIMTARVQSDYLLKARARVQEAMVRADEAEEVYRAQRVLMAREDQITRFAREKPDLESVLRQLAALTPAQVVYKDLQVRELPDGRFVLRLTGESVASTGGEAQASFLKFLTDLRASDFLSVPDEPSQLMIKPWQQDEFDGNRTLFGLDLVLAPSGRGA